MTDYPNTSSTALIVNFTGYAGHYGMLGTSLCLFDRLLDKGYDIDVLDIDLMKTLPLSTWPVEVEKIGYLLPPAVLDKAKNAAVIIINGEGTLHGNRPSSNRLLVLIEMLLDISEASLYLINFSCFPASKNTTATPDVSERYRHAIHAIAARGVVVAREYSTGEILADLGIEHVLGFDSLPLTVRRYFPSLWFSAGNTVVVSGGAGMSKDDLRRMAVAVEFVAKPGDAIVYVSGGTDEFCKFDFESHFEQIKRVVPRARFVRCASMKEMLEVFSNGVKFLFTGRFHYAIAARVLGTPCVCWTSNTPKIEAIQEQLGIRYVFSGASFAYQDFPQAVDSAIKHHADIDLQAIWTSAELNYTGIPDAPVIAAQGMATASIYGTLLERAGIVPTITL